MISSIEYIFLLRKFYISREDFDALSKLDGKILQLSFWYVFIPILIFIGVTCYKLNAFIEFLVGLVLLIIVFIICFMYAILWCMSQ